MNKDNLPLIYIGGPYTASSLAETADNIHRAMMLGVQVARLGGMPVIPHTNTPLPFLDLQTPEFWYRGTMALLLVCDVLVLRKGWRLSKGSVGEHEAAIEARLPVFYADLAGWDFRLSEHIAAFEKA